MGLTVLKRPRLSPKPPSLGKVRPKRQCKKNLIKRLLPRPLRKPRKKIKRKKIGKKKRKKRRTRMRIRIRRIRLICKAPPTIECQPITMSLATARVLMSKPKHSFREKSRDRLS